MQQYTIQWTSKSSGGELLYINQFFQQKEGKREIRSAQGFATTLALFRKADVGQVIDAGIAEGRHYLLNIVIL